MGDGLRRRGPCDAVVTNAALTAPEPELPTTGPDIEPHHQQSFVVEQGLIPYDVGGKPPTGGVMIADSANYKIERYGSQRDCWLFISQKSGGSDAQIIAKSICP